MDLEKIKIVELDILRTIIDILNRHSITYFISYGTCIGAIRHHGFIPWDDDIDIALYRHDYEKARLILSQELPSQYLYVDNRINPIYPYNFGKVRKKNTAFVHGGDAHLDIHHGIYVDIFPLDNCPDSLEETKQLMRKIRRLRRCVDLSSMSFFKYNKIRPIWQIPLIAFAKLFINRHNYQKHIDDMCVSNNNSNSKEVCCFLTPYYEKDIYPREWFGKGTKTTFENLEVTIPEKYDLYLKHIYGNYMQLPPINKQISHHDVIYSNLDGEYHPNNDFV